jgi:regulator of sigma E protease
VGIKAIPAGGYVKIPGMDLSGSEEDPAPDTYAAKPWWAQVAVALAGPATHFVIAFAVLVFTFGFLSPDTFGGAAGVSTVISESPAAAAGLESGDIVVALDNGPVSSWREVQNIISDGRPHLVTIERDGSLLSTTVSNWGGVVIPNASPVSGKGPLGVVTTSASTVVDLTDLTVDGLVGVVTGLDDVIQAAAGTAPVPEDRPVSIIGMIDLSASTGSSFGWFGVGLLVAQLNVAFGLLNLLPFYPFDGGHIAAAVTNRLLRCRWLRRPVLKGMAALSVPVLAVLLILFLASSALDVRSLV